MCVRVCASVYVFVPKPPATYLVVVALAALVRLVLRHLREVGDVVRNAAVGAEELLAAVRHRGAHRKFHHDLERLLVGTLAVPGSGGKGGGKDRQVRVCVGVGGTKMIEKMGRRQHVKLAVPSPHRSL